MALRRPKKILLFNKENREEALIFQTVTVICQGASAVLKMAGLRGVLAPSSARH